MLEQPNNTTGVIERQLTTESSQQTAQLVIFYTAASPVPSDNYDAIPLPPMQSANKLAGMLMRMKLAASMPTLFVFRESIHLPTMI